MSSRRAAIVPLGPHLADLPGRRANSDRRLATREGAAEVPRDAEMIAAVPRSRDIVVRVVDAPVAAVIAGAGGGVAGGAGSGRSGPGAAHGIPALCSAAAVVAVTSGPGRLLCQSPMKSSQACFPRARSSELPSSCYFGGACSWSLTDLEGHALATVTVSRGRDRTGRARQAPAWTGRRWRCSWRWSESECRWCCGCS